MENSLFRAGRIIAVAGAMMLLAACAGTGRMDAERPVTVAVWDLEDLSTAQHGQTGMGELLAGQIAARLGQTGGYQAVERQHLIKVIEELNIGSSDLADPQTRLRLGRIIGARQMVFGAFQATGTMLRLDLRRVDVASGRILTTATAQDAVKGVDGWFQVADQAAAELLRP
jgi:curli biogenesis system outer membrane secretion channel CsgG